MLAALAPTADEALVAWGLVLAVALAHLLPDEFSVSVGVSRHALLSATGGVSIVYAFLHLFPELDARQETVEGVSFLGWTLAAHHVYAVAFVGLALFYGLDRLAAVARGHEFSHELRSFTDAPVFWVHIGGFAVYNAFIGYALIQGETGAENALLFGVAMAVHVVGNDAALAQHHGEFYSRIGRHVLTAAVLLGALIGAVYTISDVPFAVLLGLLTGGIVYNAIKDELPQTEASRFWPFVVGSLAYGSLLLVL
ncbi:hypothetical protein ACLI4Z_02400 [Natrialbaceae archaeon A-arb3/5]